MTDPGDGGQLEWRTHEIPSWDLPPMLLGLDPLLMLEVRVYGEMVEEMRGWRLCGWRTMGIAGNVDDLKHEPLCLFTL